MVRVMRAAEASAAHRRNLALEWKVEAGAEALACQPAAPVQQVALNLLLNAGAADGKGGEVGLKVSNGADRLSIAVSNTGNAMGEADLRRLLASGPLPPGGGVGLRLVHDIVSGLGGTRHHDRADGWRMIRVDLPVTGSGHA